MALVLFILMVYFSDLGGQNLQNGSVRGKIIDKSTGEPLIGATVQVEGTTMGVVADVNGNYLLNDLKAGIYRIVISYVSYKPQTLEIEIGSSAMAELNVQLESASVEVEAVKITANKRSDTELSLISGIRTSNAVTSGISKQQISRSQDKDASEVVSRVSGVTVRDGRFINVRGLDERYNVVTLNGLIAPSSESDRRAFSFDMLPSSLIDNLVIYKTPAPEIPADFAGALVQIETRNSIAENHTEISYSTGYRVNTTFNNFYTYKGGKTDWLGFDDGTRALPEGFPKSPLKFREIADSPDESEKSQITSWGRSFKKIWSPEQVRAIPDQSVSFTIQRKVKLGKLSAGNITSVGYSTGQQLREVFRAGYQAYDMVNDRPDTAYYFNDDIYTSRVRLNLLSNWMFALGKNHHIEFRNFFNQYSDKTTLIRSGRDNYGGIDKQGTELGFISRSIYSGQLNGMFGFGNSSDRIDWSVGYSYTNKNQPDIRRIERNGTDDGRDYTLSFNFNADPKMVGRLFLENHENVYSGAIQYRHSFSKDGFITEFRTGILTEMKNRKFSARNIGFAISNVLGFNWDLAYQPVDSVFQDRNINFTDGLKIDESTDPTDSYSAQNRYVAGFVSMNFNIHKFTVYTGVRSEYNRQTLKGSDRSGDPFQVDIQHFDLFPSINTTYHLSENSLIRLAYGRTINRPEFREVSMQTYYDFEEKASIYGDTALTNAYIHNFDLRLEWFPNTGDMITLGGFYKNFRNPIEAHLVEAGSGRNYTFDNAEEAHSYGIEVDIRKSLSSLENSQFFSPLRHLTIVLNASFIRSQLHSTDPNAREKTRSMQGQSPYIINTGLFYDNQPKGLMISVLYNIIGPRLMFIGDRKIPHILQMPRNLMDITVNKRIGKHVLLKAGIKDLFNQPVELRQNERIQLINGVSDSNAKRVQRTQIYKPSSSYTLGITVQF